MSIFLVGMPGSGKTTTGLAISKELHLPFIDTDQWIEVKTAMKISQIFESKGEAYFREEEHNFLKTWTGKNWIISTGGGMPCFNQNLELMKNNGKIIYLRRPLSVIIESLNNDAMSKRPLLLGKNNESLETLCLQLLLEREPFYLKSDLIIEPDVALIEIAGLIRRKIY